ncbi:hypothetical protein Tco_1378962 [Tanacetum coccineum]
MTAETQNKRIPQAGRKYGVGLKHGNEIVYQHLKYWLGPDMATEVKRYGASSKLDYALHPQDCFGREYNVHCHIQFHLAQTDEQQYCDILLDGWKMSQCPRAIQELNL